MAADRMAGDGKGADQILAVESASVDRSAQTGGHRQTTLAHRARLRRIEAGTRPRAFRRSELARLSSPCNPVDRCLWLPGAGEVSFSPLRQLAAVQSCRHSLSLTLLATRIHAPRRCQQEPNGIIRTPLPPCAVRSLPTSLDLCRAVRAVFADSYNIVVLDRHFVVARILVTESRESVKYRLLRSGSMLRTSKSSIEAENRAPDINAIIY